MRIRGAVDVQLASSRVPEEIRGHHWVPLADATGVLDMPDRGSLQARRPWLPLLDLQVA